MALKKPGIAQAAQVARQFAEQATPIKATPEIKAVPETLSEGDVRLNANIKGSLHLRLKIESARRRLPIGDIVEEMITKYIPE
jgi:hypothetical protein